MRTIVGSQGEFRGWKVRLRWHTEINDGIVSIGKNSKNEPEELSVTSLIRAPTTVLIHGRVHTLSYSFKDVAPHADNGVWVPPFPRVTEYSVSPTLTKCSSYRLQNEPPVASDHQQRGWKKEKKKKIAFAQEIKGLKSLVKLNTR